MAVAILGESVDKRGIVCGIVGFKVQDQFQHYQSTLRGAVDALAHRGPDASGMWCSHEDGLGLGHRRLSIIDLSEAGRQPMASEDGALKIVFNGEIYNFQKLRDQLIEFGHSFRTGTDTEVILHAYRQWGMDCVHWFVGMFAIALWDRQDKRLILIRDRLGIKPLYYYHHGGLFLFASELKALMAFPRFPRDVDPEAIALFLHYQYVPAPRTIFRHTFKLLPGHVLMFDGHELTTATYWKAPDPCELSKVQQFSEKQVLDRLDALLTESVSDRLISDVPLGALLSGGIDSSLVVALMQKVSPQPVKTFSIGFHEKDFNEANWAAKVAKHLGTDHSQLYVTPEDALAVIPNLPHIYDEPFADSSSIPTYLVSQLTRSRVTVALSGDGGDEQFCGYVRYWTTRAMARTITRMPGGFRRVMAALFDHVPVSWMAKGYGLLYPHLPQALQVANFPDKWQKLLYLMTQTDIAELYRMTICLWSEADIREILEKPVAGCLYEDTFRQTERWPMLSRLMRVDQKTYLPDAMLTKVDRASMACGLEVRVPLLDHRVVEFTSRLADRFKFKHGSGKYILKQLLKRYVPEPLFIRPKMGFGVPIQHWMRNELRELLNDYLSPTRLTAEGLFDARAVSARIKEHMQGQANHQYRLWALLMWQMWRERWL